MAQRTVLTGNFGACIAILALLSGASTCLAADQTVEDVARQIASAHNRNPPRDPMVISTKARADGRTVVITTVIKAKPNLNQAQLGDFYSATRAELIPQACPLNQKNIAFQRGMSYRFDYVSSSGQAMTSILIDADACRQAGFVMPLDFSSAVQVPMKVEADAPKPTPSAAERRQYLECRDDASRRPTDMGVKLALSNCDVRFPLSSGLQ